MCFHKKKIFYLFDFCFLWKHKSILILKMLFLFVFNVHLFCVAFVDPAV